MAAVEDCVVSSVAPPKAPRRRLRKDRPYPNRMSPRAESWIAPPSALYARLERSELSTIRRMAISVAEYNRQVIEWIDAHGISDRPCPLCGVIAGWSLGPVGDVTVRTDALDGQAPGVSLPLVVLVCKNCANVVFLSAVAVGIVASAPTRAATGASQ